MFGHTYQLSTIDYQLNDFPIVDCDHDCSIAALAARPVDMEQLRPWET